MGNILQDISWDYDKGSDLQTSDVKVPKNCETCGSECCNCDGPLKWFQDTRQVRSPCRPRAGGQTWAPFEPGRVKRSAAADDEEVSDETGDVILYDDNIKICKCCKIRVRTDQEVKEHRTIHANQDLLSKQLAAIQSKCETPIGHTRSVFKSTMARSAQ